MLDFIVIGMWKPILIGCTNKVDWLIDWLKDMSSALAANSEVLVHKPKRIYIRKF